MKPRSPLPRALAARLSAGAILVASSAVAQPPDAGTPVPPASPEPAPPATSSTAPALTPPVLRNHLEADYPPDALRDRVEGSVGLDLSIDEHGAVTDARVVSPAGHGLDEAALALARRFVFEPARENGVAIPSTVQLAYEFHLPAAAPPVAPAPAAPPAPASEPVQTGPNQSTLVLARRPISAASSFSAQARDFNLRPIGSVQDILRVTPGLVTVQHSGGGKANQYFLRGFDADHGTDIAFSIDGIPINMVTHAHGQGYSDTNFIIPETVDRVEITKGPYFAGVGDFDTAGAVNLVTKDAFEHSSVSVGMSGSPGHGSPGYRALGVASPRFDGVKALFVAEVGQQNGPFDNPEDWNRYKLFNKISFQLTPTSSLTLGESSYASTWNGSGQIPARAIEQGLVTRFGSIDPTEGGDTARHQVFAGYKLRTTDNSELTSLLYVGEYRFNLYSNFTLFAADPERGDQIQQIDSRTFYGGKASFRVVHELGGVRFDTTLGGQVRSDDIHNELWHTEQRVQLAETRSDDVHETEVGAYLDEQVTPFKWLRLDVGGRADFLDFSVANLLDAPGAPRSGADGAHQLSPKANVVVTPIDRENAQLDVYANYGTGFHTNDVRGYFSSPSVTPITRAVGEEAGARTRLFERLDFAAALWRLALDNETVWNGDSGTTAVEGPTLRYGVELETRYEITPWLAADGELTYAHSEYTTAGDDAGQGLALAPKTTWSGGLSARHPFWTGRLGDASAVRAGLRFYGIGPRPASADGVLVAPGFTQVDLHLGYHHRWFDVAFDIENLLDMEYRSAQFETISRLRTEPAIGTPISALPRGFTCGTTGRVAVGPKSTFAGCDDVDYTPAYPFTMRILGTVYLD